MKNKKHIQFIKNEHINCHVKISQKYTKYKKRAQLKWTKRYRHLIYEFILLGINPRHLTTLILFVIYYNGWRYGIYILYRAW